MVPSVVGGLTSPVIRIGLKPIPRVRRSKFVQLDVESALEETKIAVLVLDFGQLRVEKIR